MSFCHRIDGACTGAACWVCEDAAPMFCRFLDTETCRAGLNIDEHRHTAQGFEHPSGLDVKGRWTFVDQSGNDE